MSLQTFNRCQQKTTNYWLPLLLTLIVILPGRLNAQCGSPLIKSKQLIVHIDATVSDDCLMDKQPVCRLLHQNLSLANTKMSHLSDSLSRLQQALTHNRAFLSDTIRQLEMVGSADRRSSFWRLLKSTSQTVFEIVKNHVAIGSVRSEMIMANHDRVTANIAVTQTNTCLSWL